MSDFRTILDPKLEQQMKEINDLKYLKEKESIDRDVIQTNALQQILELQQQSAKDSMINRRIGLATLVVAILGVLVGLIAMFR